MVYKFTYCILTTKCCFNTYILQGDHLAGTWNSWTFHQLIAVHCSSWCHARIIVTVDYRLQCRFYKKTRIIQLNAGSHSPPPLSEGGGTKSPEQTPEPVQKSVCPAPHRDGWIGVVTQIGPHVAQHAHAVSESDCESKKSVKWAKAPDRHPDGQTDIHDFTQNAPQRSKGPVDMKSMILEAGQTDRHTKNNTASASAGCKI